MYKLTEHKNLRTLTNQITYNKLLKSTRKILLETVFEFNDDFTRNNLKFRLNKLYQTALEKAITGYQISISDFNPAKPHYVEIDVVITLPNMIEHVFINVTNLNDA